MTCLKWFKSCSVLNYMYFLPQFFVSTNNPENKWYTIVSGNILAQRYEFIDMKTIYKIRNPNIFSLWKDQYSSFHLIQVEMLLCLKEENNCGYWLCWGKKKKMSLKTFKQASGKKFFFKKLLAVCVETLAMCPRRTAKNNIWNSPVPKIPFHKIHATPHHNKMTHGGVCFMPPRQNSIVHN